MALILAVSDAFEESMRSKMAKSALACHRWCNILVLAVRAEMFAGVRGIK